MFGRKKMYKKGLADGLAANLPFAEKQKAAIEHVRKEIKEGKEPLLAMKDLLQEDVGNIYEYLTNQEKTTLYKLATPFDIKELEEEEKELLVAVLYQLADDEGGALTDAQRVYIRSVQQYLEIRNPQTSADLQAVENIDSLETQKAFMQVVLEFFYLQDTDVLTEQQEEFLSFFSLNRRQAEAIETTVARVYDTIGPEGLATHYGPVQEEAEKAPAPAQSVPGEELILEQDVKVPQGEKTVYQDKILHIRAGIGCGGTLVFENCELHYGEPDGRGEIAVAESGILQMKNCKIKYHGYGKADEFFITANQGRGAVVMDGCAFTDACMFLKAERDVVLRNSKMTNVDRGFINCDRYNDEVRVVIEDCAFSFPKWSQERETDLPVQLDVIDGYAIDMSQCLVEGDFKVDSLSAADKAQEVRNNIKFLDCRSGKVSQCSFRGMNNVYQNLSNKMMTFSLTSFEHCVDAISGDKVDMTDCRIEHASRFAQFGEGSNVSGSQFNECYNTLLSPYTDGGLHIKDCEFNNWETNGAFGMLHFIRSKKGSYQSEVRSCVFNGIQAHGTYVVDTLANDKLDGYVVAVNGCQFINCNTEKNRLNDGKLIKEYDTYYGAFNRLKEQRVASVSGCTGLDEINQGSGRNENVKRMLTNAAGEPIGVEAEIG